MFSSVIHFIKLFHHRQDENKISIYSGYLTYSTLLAIVPLIMVVLSVFAAFPIFDEAIGQVKELIYDNFAPNLGDLVSRHIESFVENSKKLSYVGIGGLVVVAIMLIKSIDESLNEIWHNTQPRKLVLSFVVYTLLLIFSPLFAGGSIAISSYIFSLEMFNEQGVFSFGYKLLGLMPFFLTWLLFTLVYKLVPNTTVKWQHAMSGAMLAAIFFTLGKKLFVWYITTFPSYQAIYGALASIPIMIVWIHLSWKVVLLGGQFASVLKDRELISSGELTSPLEKKA